MSDLGTALAQVDADIEMVETELRALREARESLIAGADDVYKKIAVLLHNNECHDNHTDGCGWHYETPWDAKPLPDGRRTWDGYAHKRWLERAIERVVKSDVAPEEYLRALQVVHPS